MSVSLSVVRLLGRAIFEVANFQLSFTSRPVAIVAPGHHLSDFAPQSASLLSLYLWSSSSASPSLSAPSYG